MKLALLVECYGMPFFQGTAKIAFQFNIVVICRRSRKETDVFHCINISIRMLHEFFP